MSIKVFVFEVGTTDSAMYLLPIAANTLMDNVHNLTFGFILLIVIICMITLRLYESEDSRKRTLSLKIDRISFRAVLLSYILLNVLLVIMALYHV